MNRRLEKLEGKREKENNFAVCDIETMNWTKFIVLGYFDGKNFFEFRKIIDFFNFLKIKESHTIFAHFGGKFDFLFLLEQAFENEITIKDIIPRGSSILCLSLEIDNEVFHFRDSSALFPFSLKSLSENFDTQVKKTEWDHTKTKGYSKKLVEYLKSDCISLYQSIEKFYEWPLIKKAGPAYTVASQALRVFRTYLDEDIKNPGKMINQIARLSYFGGRTEIFKCLCKKGPLYEYDVNSLYPYVMRENKFPVDNGVLTFNFKNNCLGIYETEVECPKNIHIPILGIIHDKKYIFPVGIFTGHWTSVELEYAKTLGYKIKIIKGIYFPKNKYLFKEYINNLYSIRLLSQKNSVNDIIAKLLMNSLYGRFGMNLIRENLTLDFETGVKEFREFKIKNKNLMLYKKPVELESFTHVAIASFVTSYARIHMHKLMHPIAESVYYTDTDSIFTTKELDTGKELGQLKLEGIYENAVFLLPKTYFATGIKKKIAMKGFDRKKIQNFDINDFKNALEGDLKRFIIENEPKFATLKQALSQNKIITLTKANKKQLKSLYNKRIIIKSNDREFNTVPIELNERK